jgi:NADH-quinone oxidoreductase subunit L
MTVPLAILAVFSVLAGFVGMPHVMGPNFLEHYFEPVFGAVEMHIEPMTEWLLIGASVVAGLLGLAAAYWFYIARPEIPVNLAARFKGVYTLLWNKYYVDEIYSALFVAPGRRLALFLWEVIDVQVIDGFANWLGHATASVSRALRGMQTGYARAYALVMLIGTVVVVGWLIIR